MYVFNETKNCDGNFRKFCKIRQHRSKNCKFCKIRKPALKKRRPCDFLANFVKSTSLLQKSADHALRFEICPGLHAATNIAKFVKFVKTVKSSRREAQAGSSKSCNFCKNCENCKCCKICENLENSSRQ